MIETETLTNALVIRFTEARFDAANAPAFRERTATLVAEGATRILLDLSALKAIDSSGLGAIIGLLKRVGMAGELKLFGLSASVDKVVRLTRMDRVLSIHADRATALAALSD
jgi:anti-sigma B factor antagonist